MWHTAGLGFLQKRNAGNRTPDRLPRTLVTIVTNLSRLHYLVCMYLYNRLEEIPRTLYIRIRSDINIMSVTSRRKPTGLIYP
jgi:hypothetical protein